VLRQFASMFAPRRLCLVADGSVTIRKAAASILRDMRFQVAEAECGDEALSKCSERAPDAVLLDGGLAARDDFAFLQRIADSCGRRSPKIILCTNERDPAHIVRAISVGAHEYVIKPFDRTILAGKFERLGLVG
jgi:two-component system chemotaxis response regulator CheY